MKAKCEKRGCEKEAVNTLRFTSTVHKNLDMDTQLFFVGSTQKRCNDSPNRMLLG
jgi:hypothetical protein